MENKSEPSAQPSEITTPQFVIDELKKVAKSEGFSDVEIKTFPGMNHGDGFMSLMIGATIHGTRKVNGIITNDKLSLLCKLPPDNEFRREQFQGEAAFEQEVYMYGTVLPAFVQYQRDKGITSHEEGFFSFPRVYSIRNDPQLKSEYVIVMEDLRPANYRMWNKFQPVNIQHIRKMITEIAKFHAISLAMKAEKNEKFEEFRKIPEIMVEMMKPEKMPPGMENMFEAQIDRLLEILDPSETELIGKLKNIRENNLSMLEKCVSGADGEPFSVIGHGDSWNNNMLYKYNQKNEPTKMVFVDWQISRYASPVVDLVYFLFTATDKDIRDRHYDEILSLYHSTLVAMLKRLDIPNYANIFTLSDLYAQLHKYAVFGVVMSTMLVPMIIMDPKFIPSMDEFADKAAAGEQVDPNMFYHDSIKEAYSKRMGELMRDCLRYGYL